MSASPLLSNVQTLRRFCLDLDHTRRLPTRTVNIGGVPCGSDAPIRIQSMTTTDTMDTAGTVAQTLRMVAAGCEYVRITAPSIKEAENLRNIKDELRRQGCEVPLVADIHFTPNAAEVAARIVEKVRVNPGNYADKKQFKVIEYTDSAYQAELERIAKRFSPLVKVCQEYGTVMRIGTNHGSLSDRILSRYGDTPEGMVESALEFVRICESLGYYELVISMKASNPQVMVQAYRLLAARMMAGETKHLYPLHVGVTEAGDGEDGRIKSAMGIGALLADGLGDTVRVSLTEPPEAEMPVGRYLVSLFHPKESTPLLAKGGSQYPINPYAFHRKPSRQVRNFGGATGHIELPRVIADVSREVLDEYLIRQLGHVYWPESDKWTMLEQGCDYIYHGSREVPFMLPTGTRAIYDYALWHNLPDKLFAYPYFDSQSAFATAAQQHDELNLVRVDDLSAAALAALATATAPVVLVVDGQRQASPAQYVRNAAFQLQAAGVTWPLIYRHQIDLSQDALTDEPYENRFALQAAGLLSLVHVDGLVDGVWIVGPADAAQHTPKPYELANRTAFGLLQSARLRTTKTEYISCPSCGRTLFDLQETTAMIRARTEHLKGVKIGIMGCIVNGPGEMADADYGYVGAGPGIISLWRGQEQIKGKVPAENAVDELIALIREDGKWVEPAEVVA